MRSTVFFLCLYRHHRDLHSFPTRRSSDLACAPALADVPMPRTCLTIALAAGEGTRMRDRKSTRLNSSHGSISYAVFCLKKKTKAYWSLDSHTPGACTRPRLP